MWLVKIPVKTIKWRHSNSLTAYLSLYFIYSAADLMVWIWTGSSLEHVVVHLRTSIDSLCWWRYVGPSLPRLIHDHLADSRQSTDVTALFPAMSDLCDFDHKFWSAPEYYIGQLLTVYNLQNRLVSKSVDYDWYSLVTSNNWFACL